MKSKNQRPPAAPGRLDERIGGTHEREDSGARGVEKHELGAVVGRRIDTSEAPSGGTPSPLAILAGAKHPELNEFNVIVTQRSGHQLLELHLVKICCDWGGSK